MRLLVYFRSDLGGTAKSAGAHRIIATEAIRAMAAESTLQAVTRPDS